MAPGWNIWIDEGSICTLAEFDANTETAKEKSRWSSCALVVNKIPVSMHVPKSWLNEHFKEVSTER
jgi:hypothetical protein